MRQRGGSKLPSSRAERIGAWRRTRGTETSQYPQEKKETSIPPVAASENGHSPNRPSGRGCGRLEGSQSRPQPKRLERRARAGESPVGDEVRPPTRGVPE